MYVGKCGMDIVKKASSPTDPLDIIITSVSTDGYMLFIQPNLHQTLFFSFVVAEVFPTHNVPSKT
jgi:hypothetical protein